MSRSLLLAILWCTACVVPAPATHDDDAVIGEAAPDDIEGLATPDQPSNDAGPAGAGPDSATGHALAGERPDTSRSGSAEDTPRALDVRLAGHDAGSRGEPVDAPADTPTPVGEDAGTSVWDAESPSDLADVPADTPTPGGEDAGTSVWDAPPPGQDASTPDAWTPPDAIHPACFQDPPQGEPDVVSPTDDSDDELDPAPIPPIDPACGPSPSAPLWQPCMGAKDCDPGLVCTHAHAPGELGLCARPGGLGALCVDKADCKAGFSCTPTFLTPAVKECVPQDPVALPCSPGGICPSGQVCTTAFTPVETLDAFRCMPRGEIGASCRIDEHCVSALRCVRGKDSWEPGICLPPGQAGALCAKDGSCAMGETCEPSGPDGDSQCQAPGAPPLPCDADDDCPPCDVCLKLAPTATGACQRPGTYGVLCAADSDCAPPFHCKPVASIAGGLGVCALKGATGIPCLTDKDCANGFQCAPFLGQPYHVCVQSLPDGSPCANDPDCTLGKTCTDYYGAPTCQGTVLTACATDSDCGAGSSCELSLGGPKGSCFGVTPQMLCMADCWSKYCSACECCLCSFSAPGLSSTMHCAVCVPTPGSRGEGDGCGRSSDCSTGLTCKSVGAMNECVKGSACGAPCESNADCASGLVCVADEGGLLCLPLRKVGETCTDAHDCEPHLRCSGGTTQRCHYAPPFTPCDVDVGCGPGMLCEVTPGGANGQCYDEHLVYTGGGYECLAWDLCGVCVLHICSLYSIESTLVECAQCVPAPHSMPAGEQCVNNASCMEGLVCDSFEHCAQPMPKGSPCWSSADCVPDLLCIQKKCLAIGSSGEPCDLEAHCLPGLRCRPTVAGLSCLPPGAMGDTCTSTADCEPPALCIGVPPGEPTWLTPYSGTCGVKGDLGAPCELDTDCITGLACRGSDAGCQVDMTDIVCVNDEQCGAYYSCDWLCGACY